MLADDSSAVRRLVTVFGGSAFVGEAVSRRPELADLVLFEPTIPTLEQACAEPQRPWSAKRDGEIGDQELGTNERLEQQAGHLRRALRRVTTQVALADLGGELDTRGVTQRLSALADGCLEAATRFALQSDEVKGLALMAMGKLGGHELGYGSDLDVIFLFDPAAAPDDAHAFFSRAARRVIQLVSMPHVEGAGYELDTRLRPSGSQGLLVVSLEAFARYHAQAGPTTGEHAATWERLALLRARFCAGDEAVGRQAIAVARRAAYERHGDLATLAADVHRLRLRMERELARERPGRYDLKFGRGGLVDVEFATQLLQLRHGADPNVRTTETPRAIEALAAGGYLDAVHAEAMRTGYAFLRRLQLRIRVVHADAAHLIEERAAGLSTLARRMGIGGTLPARRLLEQYLAVTDSVRRAYEAIVVEAAGAVDPGAAG
jgi:glutamate-ammonia-ligase adenylyltransferase